MKINKILFVAMLFSVFSLFSSFSILDDPEALLLTPIYLNEKMDLYYYQAGHRDVEYRAIYRENKQVYRVKGFFGATYYLVPARFDFRYTKEVLEEGGYGISEIEFWDYDDIHEQNRNSPNPLFSKLILTKLREAVGY
ncbi:MAG: hypothetical protein COZ18_11050 [Flexibacter sp. CG_4_10_14_3_um_filter_32_15]|nr:MAG: hypothetical protein COZ18_11050 [Flexibacter sp. CG_4_10_14_3_um_filter_32_15]